ncbi:C4-dicarboxylate ABC transporter permease [Malaciobacter molluscorum LMG 25693]|uniref:C4-dicarboxylate ABC transporter permease n=1 Tax=Malaciobacter molluscorum LMG 25693 TaxID=870501 RepID=A0A2G1DK25_9BACT|nr:TRAP transporter large permease subunit [Malaciobacter molluscorum]AXX92924.1 TRAP transporter, large permease subunit [Malaciobacter molluscorum LMG 25693]PHO18754.1 C4-dicarboxylate ABC transporter permease [Malaciobacter molluscorum LMG 25693]
MSIAVLFAIFFLLVILGTPIAICLGGATFVTLLLFTSISPIEISAMMFEKVEHYSLMAIPMFIFAGNLLSKGSAAQRIIEFAKSIVGHLPGGLPISAIFASIIFAAVSGSSPATVVAIGSIMFGAIMQAGYPKKYAVGTIATAGSLGILIPPSIVLIVYGVTAEVSIGKLFMAGVVPGIMLGIMLIIVTYIGARRLGFEKIEPQPFKVRLKKMKDAAWGLMTIVIVIGGIYGSIFTPTEAAAAACMWAFFVSVFIYRDIKFTELYATALESAKTTAMIMFIIANAMLFAHFLTIENIPQMITQALVDANVNKYMFLLMVNLLLILAGSFMEPSAIIMILVPLLLPVAVALGIDPIHFGIVITVNMELGMVSPPVGLNLFVTSGLTGMSIKDVIIATFPWTMTILAGLIAITYIPEITLFLPNIMYGN